MNAPGPSPERVIAIVGPTAVGKSSLAEEIARVVDGQVVSADSMQVYRGMDIGTAKTPPEERRVAHHCIDIADPGAPFSAALFQRAARGAIESILESGARPIVAGGTGLYVRAALDDWEFPGGEAESPLRIQLEAEAQVLGAAAMHERLASVDPHSAARIHPANVRRTIRALEMAATGGSYAEQAARFSKRRSVYDVRFVGLTMDRERLYARIGERVDEMIESGLVDEVASLLHSGYRTALTASQAIGYKEIVPVLEGQANLDEAIEEIKRATRRYAKRQMTWFRGDGRISWVDVTDLHPEETLRHALMLVESDEPEPGEPPLPGTWRLAPDPDR